MSTLKRQEPVGTGLRRIACDHIEAGVRTLTRQIDTACTPVQSIGHAAAVLALIEPSLPRTTARRAHGLLQQIRLGLAPIDQPIALLQRLDSHFKKPPSDAALVDAVKALRKQWSGLDRSERSLHSRGGSFDPAVYRLVADMAELRGHAGEWPVDAIRDDAPPAGLRRTYARAHRLVSTPMTAERVRELADALALLSDQLKTLVKVCPPMLKAHRKLIDRALTPMQDAIDDVELDRLLSRQMDKPDGSFVSETLATPQHLNALISAELRTALAETPTAFHNRVQSYWSAWRG